MIDICITFFLNHNIIQMAILEKHQKKFIKKTKWFISQINCMINKKKVQKIKFILENTIANIVKRLGDLTKRCKLI